jgi:2-keto-4-pentenoate hydratase/2-oxohepta-3-ene-1,7-dioic acid hydratase in catechol pathway
MRLCRFDDNRLGVVEGDQVADVTAATKVLPPLAWPVPHGDHAIRNFGVLSAEIKRILAEAPRKPLGSVKLLSPIANPSKVMAAPLNYVNHVLESQADAGIHHGTWNAKFAEGETPVGKLGLFLKANSSVVGAGEGVATIMQERRNDHEIELTAVIGKECRNVKEEDALSVCAGFCIGLDMTVRGPEERSLRKSPDGYTVLGPWMVTSDELADPSNLDFWITVNGEVRQKTNTKELTVSLRRLISIASSWYTLYPGDVLLTGTPDGVGPVKPGDTMVAWIDKIGEMTVKVR